MASTNSNSILLLIVHLTKKKMGLFSFPILTKERESLYHVPLPKFNTIAKNKICISLVEKKLPGGERQWAWSFSIYHMEYLGNKHSFPCNGKTS